MVAAALVDSKIDAGRQLVELLDRSEFRVDAALWLLREESGSWRLVLATPLFDVIGSRETYRRLQQVLRDESPEQAPAFGINEIQVLSPKDDLIRLFKTAVRTGSTLSGFRFTGNTINGVYIDDAYVYRLG
jgi:hypothetical protein